MDATNVQATLKRVANIVGDVLHAEKVDIFIHDPTIDSLVAIGVSDTPLSRKEQARGLAQLPVANRGRPVEVFLTQQPHRDGHVDEDEQELIGIRVALGVRSTLMTPLVVGEERRGAIVVASTEPEHFSADDLTFLQAVTGWVAMVLHRAELVERIAREASTVARRKAAEELITVFAHDFRTPLTPLYGNLSMLRQRIAGHSSPEELRILDTTLRIVERMQSLTTNLLDASRIDEGIFTLSRQAVNVGALLASIVDLLHTDQKPLDLRVPVDVIVDGDPARLSQLFENLIANALRYSPDGLPVMVEAGQQQRADGLFAYVTVRDEGPGIPAEMQPFLFDRYSIDHRSSGLGLGLYLARGIIEAHGGTLNVESTFGEGATFEVLLPWAYDTDGLSAPTAEHKRTHH